MLTNILKKLLAALLISLILFAIGLLVWTFKYDQKTPLQNVFFWVGTVPVALGLFGGFSGKGDAIYQLSLLKSNQASNERAFQEMLDIKSNLSSGLNWLFAGLIVWAVGFFV